MICSFLFLYTAVKAQKADSTATDSMKVRTKSPKAAVLRSAVLPGWGQWSNGQKLKSVLVFGAEMGLAGNAAYQNRLALRSQTRDERDFYRNNRSQSIWWFAAVYFLSLADAYVDAQLWHFDAGPNLSEGSYPQGMNPQGINPQGINTQPIDSRVMARIVFSYSLHE